MKRKYSRFKLWIVSLLAASCISVPLVGGQQQQRGVEDVSSPKQPAAQPGPYYALVIGNNNYRNLPKLQTAVNDANALAGVLKDSYGFQVKVVDDATRIDILNSMNEYRRSLPPNSNLLIYYAGHGHHDRDTDEAYWLPVDAEQDNNANWISADDITSDVRAMPALHVLIISDSCYSGALATRDADAAINPSERHAYLAKMLAAKSRNLMASGGDEPVADDGAAGHSVFSGALLRSLQQANDEFTAGDLFQRYIQQEVAGKSAQVPQYSFIRNSGHDYGDFVFPPRGGGGLISDTDIPINGHEAPPKPPVDPEAEAINSALHHYKDAYESESVDELTRIWPTLTNPQKKALNRSFNDIHAIKLILDCGDPAISGNSARVRCSQDMRYTSGKQVQQVQHNTVEVLLKKSDRGWLVDGVQSN